MWWLLQDNYMYKKISGTETATLLCIFRFVLTKAFSLIDQKSLFTVLQKADCLATLLSLLKDFPENKKGNIKPQTIQSKRIDV